MSRSEGRKIRIDSAVKDPKLEEIAEASRSIGYDPELNPAHYPKRMNKVSGYVILAKKIPKTLLIKELSKSLREVRARREGA